MLKNQLASAGRVVTAAKGVDLSRVARFRWPGKHMDGVERCYLDTLSWARCCKTRKPKRCYFPKFRVRSIEVVGNNAEPFHRVTLASGTLKERICQNQ
jgi:hypothetical protein